MAARFQILIRSPELRHNYALNSGADFKLGDIDLDRIFQISLPKRERDLLRILFGVWAADRLVRRPRRRQEITGSREIDLEIDVAQPDFWNDEHTRRLLDDAVKRLSNDFWSFRFNFGPVISEQLALLPEVCAVCQYSAGLDSASGLSHRVSTDPTPVITVTAGHQSFHGQVRSQISRISTQFKVPIHPVICRTRLAHPPNLNRQETSQRLRGALFLGLGGAVASAVKARTVDVFENGIGALNVPPQAGMMLGAMATRGCHPGFLMAMGRLVSHVAGRDIQFQLPMLRMTKAEGVRYMRHSGVAEVASNTMSCVHWPLRNKGPAKQCGVCFGCLSRRQAMLVAGVLDPIDGYEVDMFGPHAPELYSSNRLLPLKACLMQVVNLRHLFETRVESPALLQHLARTEVLNFGMEYDEVVELHRRYVAEWQPLIADAKDKKLPWASWVKRVGIAA